MAQLNKRRDYDYNYIEGNAVRKLQPAYEPEIERPERPERKVNPKVEERRRKRLAKDAVIDFRFTMLVGCVCLTSLFSCAGFLQMQAQISEQRMSIAAMQTELSQLTNENVAQEEQLNSSVNLNEIYTKASKEFGMKYADSNHIILYESADPDYVRQYQDIPENK